VYSYRIILFLFLFSNFVMAQTVEPDKLTKEIQDLNRNNQLEQSIIVLENIINNRKSTHLDRYYAYLLKSLTYKRVFDYASAQKNLELAYDEGIKSNKKEEVKTRIAIELLFVNFDQQRYDNIDDQIKKIEAMDLSLVDSTTLAFYYNVLAALDMKNNKFDEASKKLLAGISLIENHDPQHLPAVYIKQIQLSQYTDDEELALEAFRKGVHFSEKFSLDIYKMELYRQLSRFYFLRENYKNAYQLLAIVGDLIGSFEAPSRSGELNALERKIMESRKDLELRNDRNILIFISVLSVILLILIGVLFKLYRVNKRSRMQVELENKRIRKELDIISKELNESNQGKIDLSKFNLTERQLEIIELIKKGKSNKEIAAQLFISENTVKYHLKVIYNLLGIDNRDSLKS